VLMLLRFHHSALAQHGRQQQMLEHLRIYTTGMIKSLVFVAYLVLHPYAVRTNVSVQKVNITGLHSAHHNESICPFST
jgi:hypothetical protein